MLENTSSNTNQLDKVVKQYLEMETNYALLITGGWGVGKTYYFEKTLKPNVIEKTKLRGESKKYFKPIKISLYGIQSLDDLYKEIFLNIYPLLKKKGIKITSNILKAALRGVFQMKFNYAAGEFDKTIQDIFKGINTSETINFGNLVLCFDDLERRSDELNLKDLLGFINSLVEDGNNKVIIIANDGKIDTKEFNDFKEKTIGITIPFLGKIEDVFESILEKKVRYKTNDSFAKFLLEEKEFLIFIFNNAKEKNLRVLIFSLGFLEHIYYEIEKKYKKEINEEFWKKRLKCIIGCTLSISIAFKNNEFSYNNSKGIGIRKLGIGRTLDNLISTFQLNADSKNKSEEIDYVKIFYKKFNSNFWDFSIFTSIFDFITGAKPFQINSLEKELQYMMPAPQTNPANEVFNKLTFRNIPNLENKDFRVSISKLIKFAENGEYSLHSYLSIYCIIEKYNFILKLNLDNLTQRLSKGMEKSSERSKYEPLLGLHLDISDEYRNNKHIIKLRQRAIELNTYILEKQQILYGAELWELFLIDQSKFYRRTLSEFQRKPVFIEFNKNKFYSKILRMSNFQLNEFLDFLRVRYGSGIKSDFLEEEMILKFIGEKLSKKIGKGISNITNSNYKSISDSLIRISDLISKEKQK